MLHFSIQNASPRCDEKGLRRGGCEMTILSSDMFGSSNRLYIGGSNSGIFCDILISEFRGRHSIW